MGSVEILQWIGDGYVAGEPIQSALFTAIAFLGMPFAVIHLLLGGSF
ncbi:hypothetical protein ACIBED_06775 [Rhodococcus coprophilus]|jgi:hypothetical protein|uniref:Uncharacterized protein n=1 Tax=Rhodococcus coprophilus TaxID=38310 RepID=A0A2X4UDJ9_9NOCA|nr:MULTISPECIES: hypothetical protein [Rhodococcus]MBM7460022.1 hypothetical protein [Rhodococcus coprophilus]NMD94571.1 hypothetical protein [Rhodococcus sp. BL-253-APC-6A1W]NME78299.1 hypothetical protein [Rhodococcus sp. 105337]SQI37937.1 Uncharacterised protein [Rhodococcus coprophilus]